MTMLTWCEDCGTDMHQEGGDSCDGCDRELCYRCLKLHIKECPDYADLE